MDDNIIIPRSELVALMRMAAIEGISEYKKTESHKPKSDAMSFDDTVDFINEQGINIKKKTLYNFVSGNKIPYSKVGKMLVFSKKNILSWIDDRRVCKETKSDAALRIADNIRHRKKV